MAEKQEGAIPATGQKPTVLQLILFAFPSLPHAFIALPLNIVIPAFYAAHTAVTLAQIGTVTAASRILDAFLDPTMGYLSDRTRSRIGKRKPWVMAAAVVCSIAIFFLFRPPANADFIYYGTWSFLLYLGFTLFEIPRQAWMAELSRDYVQRARVGTYVSIANTVGSLVFWLMPLLLVGITGTTALTGTSIGGIAYLYVALMPIGVLLAVLYVPMGAEIGGRLATVRELFYTLRANKPFLRYNLVYSAWGLGQGAYLSVIVIFLSDYLHMAAAFPVLMIFFFGAQTLFMPFWQRMITRYGKHRVWSFSLITDVLSRPLVLLVVYAGGGVPMLLATSLVTAFLNAPQNICPGAVLGDVVDYDIMTTRVNKAGNIFAFNTLLVKATMAIGAGLAFGVLSAFHYKVGHDNTPSANVGLLIVYLVYPAVMDFIAAGLVWSFPIDARRHGIILRRIERRIAAPPLAVADVP